MRRAPRFVIRALAAAGVLLAVAAGTLSGSLSSGHVAASDIGWEAAPAHVEAAAQPLDIGWEK